MFQGLSPPPWWKEGTTGEQGDSSTSDSPPGGQRAPLSSPSPQSSPKNPQPAWEAESEENISRTLGTATSYFK